MKKVLKSMIVLIAVLFAGITYAQTTTNVDELNRLSQVFSAQWETAQVRVQQFAQENDVPIKYTTEDGRAVEMIDVHDGQPVYRSTDNHGAAETTRAAELWTGGSLGLDLTGDGYVQLGHWDFGKVRITHQEFTDQGSSRVIWMDNNMATGFHATHTAGTMIAGGVEDRAKGMGYAGLLKSWDHGNDNSEMANAAANGLEISNHSYGILSGWDHSSGSWIWRGNASISPDEAYQFGFYDSQSRGQDIIANNAPYYLIVRSAGNDRGEGPSGAGSGGLAEKDGGDDGYDCISYDEIAKNVLTIGAVGEVLNYTGPDDVHMASFSSWGPADDGRIKPDICGKGLGVYSTYDGSDDDYATSQGTSMSAPNVSGTAALLQLHYQNLNNGDPMRAATLKGIILHTADEAGPDPGPDYMFGWGLMNAERAAMLITDDQGQNAIDELVLEGGDIYQRTINVPDGTPELRITISWTDPAAIPVQPQLNPRDPMIINNLDLMVFNSKTTFYPYKLDPDNPSAAATNDSENDVDNIETIVIPNPEPGSYTIFIDHNGVLQGNEAAYSLIISGTDDYTVVPECSMGMSSPDDGAVDILVNEYLTWFPANFASSYDIYFGTDGGGTQTPTNVFNGENIPANGFSYYMGPNTTYYLQVIPKNSQGEATGCDDIWTFTTMEAISVYPYHETFDNLENGDLPFGYQSADLAEPEWQSTKLAGNTDNRSMVCFNTDGIVKSDYDNWFISLPFAVEDGNEYNATYYYKSFFAGKPESMSVYWGLTPYVDDLTNLVAEYTDFDDPTWVEGEGLIIPGQTGSIYLGFHVTSTQGYGVFFDDLDVEFWGPVGIDPNTGGGDAKVYAYDGKVRIIADQSWDGADIQIMNMMGQMIYQGTYHGKTLIDIKSQNSSGLYIVTLGKGSQLVTEKVLIK